VGNLKIFHLVTESAPARQACFLSGTVQSGSTSGSVPFTEEQEKYLRSWEAGT
jgi:hypothetical protein